MTVFCVWQALAAASVATEAGRYYLPIVYFIVPVLLWGGLKLTGMLTWPVASVLLLFRGHWIVGWVPLALVIFNLIVNDVLRRRRPPWVTKQVDLNLRALMTAYRSGREGVLLALYKVLVSTLRDSLGDRYSEEQVKSAAANVINRMTLRTETRADPRLAEDAMASDLRELCDRQLVKEAAALVLMLDVCAGDLPDLEAASSRLTEAERLAPANCAAVRARLDPRTADPSDVEATVTSMANVLLQTADYSVLDDMEDV